MKLKIRYVSEGVPYEVTTTLATIVAWERRFKRKASEMAQAAGIEDLAYMAWEAAKAAKIVVPGSFDMFVEQLEEIDVLSEDGPRPT
jgi:hypothetical protein